MAAEVETMFYTRQTPWHGLGTRVTEDPASKEALSLSDLDRKVEQEDIYTGTGNLVPGFKANIRSTDRKVLGVVTDCYKVKKQWDYAGYLYLAAGGENHPPNIYRNPYYENYQMGKLGWMNYTGRHLPIPCGSSRGNWIRWCMSSWNR